MRTRDLPVQPPPRFVRRSNGRTKHVTLEPAAYVQLLIRANITNPAAWPPGMQQGAAWLKRIRQIEQQCVRRHGEWDWEKLSSKLQDEYDDNCAMLDQLLDTGERFPLRDLLREEGDAVE